MTILLSLTSRLWYLELVIELRHDEEGPPAPQLLGLEDVPEDVIPDIQDVPGKARLRWKRAVGVCPPALGSDELGQHLAVSTGVDSRLLQRETKLGKSS